MSRKIRFSVGEYYHCYSRGVDKRVVFMDVNDWNRFRDLLYLVNDTSPLRWGDLQTGPGMTFKNKRNDPLVSVIAYCLMPNHYHLVIREVRKDGVSTFMHKLGVAYTTYFNAKYERVGNLFVRPFRAKHVKDDIYLKHLINYVHLNPAELFENGWKEGGVVDRDLLKKELLEYEYSSLSDHLRIERPSKTILDSDELSAFQPYSLDRLMSESAEYYEEMHAFSEN